MRKQLDLTALTPSNSDSKVGETIVIKTEDLKENSSVYEERICDCCGTLYGTTH